MDLDLYSWQILTTAGGCVAATIAIVQFFKPYIQIPTQLLSYAVSLVIFNAALIFLGEWSLSQGALSLLNSLVISTSSNGLYQGGVSILQAVEASRQADKTTDEAGGGQ